MQEKNDDTKTQKFPKFGFRRNTHKNGKFDQENANFWQLHIWSRTIAKDVGALIPTTTAISFSEIVNKVRKKSKDMSDMDEEEIALLLIQLVECKLVVIEEIEPYETDLYNDGVKFFKGT